MEPEFYCNDFDYCACNDRKEVGKYPILLFIENNRKFFEFESYEKMASVFLPYSKRNIDNDDIFKDGEFNAYIDQLIYHVKTNNIDITHHNDLYKISKDVYQKFKYELVKQKRFILFNGMVCPRK